MKSYSIYIKQNDVDVHFDREDIRGEENKVRCKNIFNVVKNYLEDNNFKIKKKYDSHDNYLEAHNNNVIISFNYHRNFYLHITPISKYGMYDKWKFAERKWVDVWVKRISDVVIKYCSDFQVINKKEDELKREKMTEKQKLELSYMEGYHTDFANKRTDFKLEEMNGWTKKDSWDNKHSSYSYDRDGKLIVCGEIKYCRDYRGYLNYGKAYFSSNGTWYLIDETRNFSIGVWHNQLFDVTEEDFKVRRFKKGNKDLEYFKRIKLSSDSPEVIFRDMLLSDLTCRKLANVISNYAEYKGLDKYTKTNKLEDEFYSVSAYDSGWNKAYYEIKNIKQFFALTYRWRECLILYNEKNERIFEITKRKIITHNPKELQRLFKHMKQLLKEIKNRLGVN